jgi:hypothetical protein
VDITWENICALLARLKDGSVILGILYFISFLFLMPFWVVNAPSAFGTKAVLLFAALTAFLLTHIFLNWTYYALVAAPAFVAIVLFVVGATIWVATPIAMAPVQAIFGFFSGGFGGGIADMVAGKMLGGFGTLISGVSETISRVG